MLLLCPLLSFGQRQLLGDTAAQIKIVLSGKATDAQLRTFYETIVTADRLDLPNKERLMDIGLQAAKRIGHESYYNQTLCFKLFVNLTQENRESTIKKLKAITEQARNRDDDTLAAIANYVMLRAKGQTISPVEATKELYECAAEFKRLGLKSFEIRARANYALFYGYGGTFDRTRQLYNIPLSMARQEQDTIMLMLVQNNKANIFYNARMYDSAMACVRDAERYGKELPTVAQNYITKITKAEIYFAMGKYKECLALCDTLEKVQVPGRDAPGVGLWKIRGISLGKVGRYVEQEAYCQKAIEATRAHGLMLEQDEIWMALAKAQLMQGKHEEALRSLDSSKVIGGRYYDVTISKQMTEAEAKLNSAEQRFQIQKLENEKRTQSKINYLLTAILLLAITLLIVGMLLGLKLYRGRKALQQQNVIIEAQNQQLSSLNSSKDKIMGIIAHDLRSPLSTLSSLSMVGQEMVDKGNKEDLQELFGHITTSAANLNTLVTNLFNWAVSLDGNLAVKLEPLAIQEIVNKVAELYADKAKSKNIQLAVKVNAEYKAYADYNSVLTITRNLVNNALKFTPNGGNIIITAHEEDKHTVLSVQDNGKGMTEAQLQGLKRTERAKHTRGTEGETGTGLGMLIVKELVAINNGAMVVSSGPGLGTTIRVKLPRTEQDIPAEKQTPEGVISIVPLAYPVINQG